MQGSAVAGRASDLAAACGRRCSRPCWSRGHTHDVPIGKAVFADNWDLASTRAVNSYKALMSFQPSPGDLQNGSGEALLEVSAYEAHRPVSLEPTPGGRCLNRRIDLRFLIAAPLQAQFTEIRRQIRHSRSP